MIIDKIVNNIIKYFADCQVLKNGAPFEVTPFLEHRFVGSIPPDHCFSVAIRLPGGSFSKK